MAQLILASSSPRRKEILKYLGQPFEIVTNQTDETVNEELKPWEKVILLSKRKAKSVADKYSDAFVIGADTIVECEGRVLGKPNNAAAAKEMLFLLSGKTHAVYTGVTILHGQKSASFYEKTNVTFWELTEEEIEHYIQSGEPFDKAGSYGIQGYGALLVEKIDGDFFSVVGLPIANVYRTLKALGYPF